MRVLVLSLAISLGGGLAEARPLITSSEETYARICVASTEDPGRIIQACNIALAEPSLTKGLRLELLLAKGDAHRFADEYDWAKSAYDTAIELDPNYAPAWAGLGWARRALDDYAGALEAFDAALDLRVTAHGLMGRASVAYALGEIDGAEARDLLRTSLDIEPDAVWALREIGWTYLEDGEFAEALAAFGDAIHMSPDDPGAYYGAGEAARHLGDLDEALNHFNTAMELDPTYLAARIQHVVTLRELDRNAQAVRQADKIIADHPDVASGYVERALALMGLERRYEAQITLRYARTSLGASNLLSYWYADVLAEDGQFEEALVAIEEGLALEGAGSADHVLKAYIAISLGDNDLAVAASDAAIALDPASPWGYYYRALGAARLGQVDAAVDAFRDGVARGLSEDDLTDLAEELYAAGHADRIADLRLLFASPEESASAK